MGVDVRIGRKDHYNRFKVFNRDYDYKTAIVANSECKGVFYAKDITSFNKTISQFNTRFARANTSGNIETYDLIQIDVGAVLYCEKYNSWWIVESVNEETINETEQHSRRPSSRKVIAIRKGS